MNVGKIWKLFAIFGNGDVRGKLYLIKWKVSYLLSTG